MNQEELKELIYFLSQKDISEFSIERADSTVRIKRRVEAQGQAGASPLSTLLTINGAGEKGAGAAADDDASPVPKALKTAEELYILKSPMVGIFRRRPAPGGRPFLTEGDLVEVGQVVCTIEVLRLMHEVESDVAGEVVEIMVGDRETVEYGQALLAIRPGKKPI